MTTPSQPVIFDAFSLSCFLKACYLQGVKKRNALLFNSLMKTSFPVIFGFFPVIFPVNSPVIP